jgi:putative sigma-54 modulation protein
MQLDITGHHLEITDSLRNYVNEKMEKINRHFDNVGNSHVILSVEKNRMQAEAKLNVTGGELFANAEDEDMYAAIDALIEKLDRQVKKHKEKLTDHHRTDKVVVEP